MSSDIPHHVSSFEMIDSLMVSMATVLQSLPKPTLITMARYIHVNSIFTCIIIIKLNIRIRQVLMDILMHPAQNADQHLF